MASAAVRGLGVGGWGLARARTVARTVERSPAAVTALLGLLFGDVAELRKRAADVAQRIVEVDPAPLVRYADELAGLLAELPVEESRTRWHLGIAVARVAITREQRLRAGRLMILLAEDPGVVARCSGIEGIARLACVEPSLRGVAEEIVAQALRGGEKAERCRARHAERWMRRVYERE